MAAGESISRVRVILICIMLTYIVVSVMGDHTAVLVMVTGVVLVVIVVVGVIVVVHSALVLG